MAGKPINCLLIIIWVTLIFSQYAENVYGQEGKKNAMKSTYFEGDVMAPWEGGPSYYTKWSNGPSSASDFFPIAVWLQNPERESSVIYKSMGINTYIGLHKGPTEAQLTAVANLPVATYCDQNAIGLTSSNNGVIKAWTHIDEPDNAVSGTQIPVLTDTIVARYNKMKSKDNKRPVFLNLGQGVACDAWYGRGNRTRHPEDYEEYSKGADILSFDVYPMNVSPPLDTDTSWKKTFKNEVTHKPWYVAIGVDRLRQWVNYAKPVWSSIECTNINGSTDYALTPSIVKAEVWMALIHGARGILYFCHQITPFVEAGLLANTEMCNGVAAINEQITSLAEVLNTQSVANGFTTVSGNSEVSVDAMLKRFGGNTYLFAVAMRPGTTNATFTLTNLTGNTSVEVVGENRNLQSVNGAFQDTFTNYAVHIYKFSHVTGVSENPNSMDYNLYQNTPNPFHQSTTISYQIPDHGLVKLNVYNIYGGKIATLVDETKQPGKYDVRFNTPSIQSSIYICKMQVVTTGNNKVFLASQKMLSYIDN